MEASFIKDFEQYLRKKYKCTTNNVNAYIILHKHVVSKTSISGILHINLITFYKAKHIQKDMKFLNNEEL